MKGRVKKKENKREKRKLERKRERDRSSECMDRYEKGNRIVLLLH